MEMDRSHIATVNIAGNISYVIPDRGGVMAVRIFFEKDSKTPCMPMADLAFANGEKITICWANPVDRSHYDPLINGYTLFYDERPKADFDSWISK